MTPSKPLHRRTYLGAVGAAGVGVVAGCLDALNGDDDPTDNVVLDEPEQYEMLREARDNGDVPYPIYGDPLPDVSAPCTIRGEDVATGDFEGDRHSLYTFIFVRCHGACPGLVSGLRHVQAEATDEGYADDVGLVTVTFDPEYDTPEVLDEYGERMGVEYDANNWYFLRPETEDDARHYVEDEFGCYFERDPRFDEEEHGHDDDGHDDDGHDDDGHDDDGHDDGDGNDHDDGHDDEGDDDDDDMVMAFQHESMIVLANADGYVERTYVGEVPSPDVLIDDTQTLVDRW